ncbi:uncharacterized protein AMSG_00701 [Thecamonas trahens ATCC 50062]|uniref:Uncharacterized protein n=1 Tax=Thecamonas trahens ATCC 50062 TaxID=461836 RepID=A0A0L0DE14_THETB|nr:hypothetical protein AMSG_00701 [Thecamonas trahens ATCC 50062]KNC50539.1 hypothetical protein AMSG_00701 [Thecamonas trahens ATCC 50062]|eukprot:XP_013762431.1 hypothetical protein AMSG_00701 [Thecamonas trahens ATCC 50062]
MSSSSLASAFTSECTRVGVEPSSAVASALTAAAASGTLTLSSVHLAPRTCTALAAALCWQANHGEVGDSAVTIVDVSDCFLGDDGAVALVQGLVAYTPLEKLDVRGNNIRTDGALALARLLRDGPPGLSTMLLEWNSIGVWDVGIRALADALAVNGSLTMLDLRNNRVGPQGVEALASALKTNTSLRTLDLRWNNAGIMGGRYLVEALANNSALTRLDLAGNEVPTDVVEAIAARLAANAVASGTSPARTPASATKARTPLAALAPNTLAASSSYSSPHPGSKPSYTPGQAKLLDLETKMNDIFEAKSLAQRAAMDMESALLHERTESTHLVASLQEKLLAERATIADLEARLRTARGTADAELAEAQADTLRAQARADEFKSLADELSAALSAARASADERIDAVRAQVRAAEEARADQVSALRQEHADAVRDMHEQMNSKLARYDAKLEEALADRTATSRALSAERERSSSLQQQLQEVVAAQETTVEREVASRLTAHKHALKLAEEARDDATLRLADAQDALRQAHSQAARADEAAAAAAASLRSQLQESNRARERLEEDKTNLRYELDKWQHQVESLQSARTTLRTQVDSLKGELESAASRERRLRSEYEASTGALHARIAELEDALRRAGLDLQREREAHVRRLRSTEALLISQIQNTFSDTVHGAMGASSGPASAVATSAGSGVGLASPAPRPVPRVASRDRLAPQPVAAVTGASQHTPLLVTDSDSDDEHGSDDSGF